MRIKHDGAKKMDPCQNSLISPATLKFRIKLTFGTIHVSNAPKKSYMHLKELDEILYLFMSDKI